VLTRTADPTGVDSWRASAGKRLRPGRSGLGAPQCRPEAHSLSEPPPSSLAACTRARVRLNCDGGDSGEKEV
jgi:hypothetical protein